MEESNTMPIEYQTWDEAFRGLLPVLRQESVRVGSYAQVIYLQACASGWMKKTSAWKDRMKEEYADLAYKCGLYHQLGKALLAKEAQILADTATEEERASYMKYLTDGRLLVARLQDKKMQDPKKADKGELRTKNIPWLMVRETCEQHMERWDGSGYPKGLKGEEISPIAQIVGLAKELDRLASGRKSENPFDEAYVALLTEAGKGYDPELIEILSLARGQCRGVYRKYIQYTKTLPKTIPLVDKRKDRTMGLRYRAISSGLYEAVPWFGGVLNEPDKKEAAALLEPMLVRTKLISDIMFYFLYEAADTLLRMQNCRLETDGILVPLMAGFYKGESQQAKLEQLFADQPIDRGRLLLAVPMEAVLGADKLEKENLITYIESGYQLVLDGYDPEALSLDRVREIGFGKVRLASRIVGEAKTNAAERLMQYGIACLDHAQGDDCEEETLIDRLLSDER